MNVEIFSTLVIFISDRRYIFLIVSIYYANREYEKPWYNDVERINMNMFPYFGKNITYDHTVLLITRKLMI